MIWLLKINKEKSNMKFDDAFEKVLKKMPKEQMPSGDDNIAKTLAFLWSLVAIAKNKLDDIAYIDKNNNIISIPLQKSSSANTTAKTGKNKSVGDVVKVDNGKEKEKPEATEESSKE